MYVKVRVKAGMRRETIRMKAADHLEIDVKEEAEGNRANHRVIQLVAMRFKVPIKRVRIVKGHRSPSKILDIS
ncbi:DUF167 domain-containing protein [Candidatus Kaiserbacteria bacterium]|nr:DUF167 domain-containing protein [Candidatus Kaiserbacteria bacterium]